MRRMSDEEQDRIGANYCWNVAERPETRSRKHNNLLKNSTDLRPDEEKLLIDTSTNLLPGCDQIRRRRRRQDTIGANGWESGHRHWIGGKGMK